MESTDPDSETGEFAEGTTVFVNRDGSVEGGVITESGDEVVTVDIDGEDYVTEPENLFLDRIDAANTEEELIEAVTPSE